MLALFEGGLVVLPEPVLPDGFVLELLLIACNVCDIDVPFFV
jgi:hypothetical protein